MADNYVCTSTQEGVEAYEHMWDRAARATGSNVAERIADDFDLELVGEGKSRMVFVDHRGEYIQEPHACVVKINKRGKTDSNETEIEHWESAPDELQEFLTPVTDHGPEAKWLIMPYIPETPTKEQMFEYEKNLLQAGWKVEDISRENAGVVGTKVVAIDYDFPIKHISELGLSVEERIQRLKWKWEQT